VEVSHVRRRLQAAMTTARDRAQRRRQLAADAETAYDSFLSTVATPLVKQIANALQAEGYAFTLSTPGRGLRLALDRGRDDFIELALETDADEPTVIGRIRRTRGSRTIEEERPVKRGASPDQVSEQDLLDFFANALEPWLGR
jgi:ribosomal protein S8